MSSSTTNLQAESTSKSPYINPKHNGHTKSDTQSTCRESIHSHSRHDGADGIEERSVEEITVLERKLVRKVDLRLCTIAGILCSLNLLDSGIISSASVTSIFEDLGLGVGNRYSVSILVYTVASVTFQLPATILVRTLGPRIVFSSITIGFGLVTLVSYTTNVEETDRADMNSAQLLSTPGNR